jgi:hypothetical protein
MPTSTNANFAPDTEYKTNLSAPLHKDQAIVEEDGPDWVPTFAQPDPLFSSPIAPTIAPATTAQSVNSAATIAATLTSGPGQAKVKASSRLHIL